MKYFSYVLITAARNEEKYIESTLKAVLSQTILPDKWVIISDASTDRTDDIIKSYQKNYNIIHFIRIDSHNDHSADFASKVIAINSGYEFLKNSVYNFIGHLDADITFEPSYYEDILKKFEENPKLGIAGGFILEPIKGKYEYRPYNTSRSVAGGIQVFRRECYESIGELIPLRMGGEDWYAEVKARMNGWEVKSFKNIHVYHHKSGVLVRGRLKESFRQGVMDYNLGSHPLFEIMKCIRRITEKPHFLGILIRILGFFWAYFLRRDKLVSEEFIKYIRREQLMLIKDFFATKRSLE
jgi:glycosyltransferase involved in cell wall biosynthesis